MLRTITAPKLHNKIGCSKNDPYLTHRRNYRCPKGGRGCQKNVLNFYGMSRYGRGCGSNCTNMHVETLNMCSETASCKQEHKW